MVIALRGADLIVAENEVKMFYSLLWHLIPDWQGLKVSNYRLEPSAELIESEVDFITQEHCVQPPIGLGCEYRFTL